MAGTPISRVAIVGLGALGIMYGHFLARAIGQENVFFVCNEERVNRYKGAEVTFNGEPCPFVYATSDAAPFKPDLVIFAVKGNDLEEAVRMTLPLIEEDTVIISVLNGISSEETIGRIADRGLILPCIAQKMDAKKDGFSVISGKFGELCFGAPAEAGDALKDADVRLKTFFDSIAMPYEAADDIEHKLWCKWMLNVGVNQVMTVGNAVFADVHKEGALRSRMLGAMREVQALSKAVGGVVEITEKDFTDWVAIIDSLNPAGMPSMRQDRLAKRPSEVEFFSGTVIAKGREYGVATPINDALYREIKAIEADY